MSRITKKKYVEQEVEELVLPSENQQIVKVTASRGNNLHEVVDASSATFLVSMPVKFRKNIWIKRGDFIIIDPIEEGDKVKGEIAHILFEKQIHHIQDEGLWPEVFGQRESKSTDDYIEEDMLPPSDSEDEDDLPMRVCNINRASGSHLYEQRSDSEDEEEDEEEEGEEQEEEEEETEGVKEEPPKEREHKDSSEEKSLS